MSSTRPQKKFKLNFCNFSFVHIYRAGSICNTEWLLCRYSLSLSLSSLSIFLSSLYVCLSSLSVCVSSFSDCLSKFPVCLSIFSDFFSVKKDRWSFVGLMRPSRSLERQLVLINLDAGGSKLSLRETCLTNFCHRGSICRTFWL